MSVEEHKSGFATPDEEKTWSTSNVVEAQTDDSGPHTSLHRGLTSRHISIMTVSPFASSFSRLFVNDFPIRTVLRRVSIPGLLYLT